MQTVQKQTTKTATTAVILQKLTIHLLIIHMSANGIEEWSSEHGFMCHAT